MGLRKEENIVDDSSSISTSSDLGVDNVVCMNIDKYLDDLEKTLHEAAATTNTSSSGVSSSRTAPGHHHRDHHSRHHQSSSHHRSSASSSQAGTNSTEESKIYSTFGRDHRFSHRYSDDDPENDPFTPPATHHLKHNNHHPLNNHHNSKHHHNLHHSPSHLDTKSHHNHNGNHQRKYKSNEYIASINLESETEDQVSQLNESSPPLQLIWRNLCYQAKTPSWFSSSSVRKNYRRNILEKQNGSITGGQITAIIGPSGAGKSTLLECLAGRRKTGLKGDIFVAFDKRSLVSGGGTPVSSVTSSSTHIKISLIGQKDEAIGILTVREVLEFASRIKNYHRKMSSSKYYTKRLVSSVLEELNLQKCADVKVAKISGGQLKRLVFGVELISGPDIILLDEPTSG